MARGRPRRRQGRPHPEKEAPVSVTASRRFLSAAVAGLLVLGVALTGLYAEDRPTNPATKPAERLKQKGWKDRHERFVERARQGDVDVLFLGDSITQGWEGAGRDAWKESLAPLKPANFGIGGDQTQHVLWRITAGKELEGIHPKVAVMMIGTNNVGGNSAAQIAEGIEAIVKELRRQRPDMQILLLGVFPRAGKRIPREATEAKADELQPKIKQINQIIAKLDDGKKVHYLDIGDKFLEKDGSLSKAVMPDYLHLSKKGYEIWAKAITPALEKMLRK
jgi:lysophospholipase L1-like esterase